MFSMVAEATDSPTFVGSTSVAQLWASLPDLPAAPELIGDALRPLFIESAEPPEPSEVGPFGFLSPKYATIAYPEPPRVRAALGEVITGERSGESIAEALVDYPTAKGVRTDEIERPKWFRGNSRPVTETLLSFPGVDGENQSLYKIGDAIPQPPGSFYQPARFAVRPRIGTGDEPSPSQLMTLWALVYALSQLARYHPDAWVSALNPDTSRIAVDLEHVLDAALSLVPDLLVPAVSNGLTARLVRESREAESAAEVATPSAETAPEAGAT